MTIFTVFFQMLAFLLMIGAGYFITRRGMLDEHANSQISGLLVHVFNHRSEEHTTELQSLSC